MIASVSLSCVAYRCSAGLSLRLPNATGRSLPSCICCRTAPMASHCGACTPSRGFSQQVVPFGPCPEGASRSRGIDLIVPIGPCSESRGIISRHPSAAAPAVASVLTAARAAHFPARGCASVGLRNCFSCSGTAVRCGLLPCTSCRQGLLARSCLEPFARAHPAARLCPHSWRPHPLV